MHTLILVVIGLVLCLAVVVMTVHRTTPKDVEIARPLAPRKRERMPTWFEEPTVSSQQYRQQYLAALPRIDTKCGQCGGTGRIAGSYSEFPDGSRTCPICHGTGETGRVTWRGHY